MDKPRGVLRKYLGNVIEVMAATHRSRRYGHQAVAIAELHVDGAGCGIQPEAAVLVVIDDIVFGAPDRLLIE